MKNYETATEETGRNAMETLSEHTSSLSTGPLPENDRRLALWPESDVLLLQTDKVSSGRSYRVTATVTSGNLTLELQSRVAPWE